MDNPNVKRVIPRDDESLQNNPTTIMVFRSNYLPDRSKLVLTYYRKSQEHHHQDNQQVTPPSGDNHKPNPIRKTLQIQLSYSLHQSRST
jgi:hypothetical protein